MLVFRDAWEETPTAEAFARLDAVLARAAAATGEEARDLATEALIESGALEAALVDALSPERDERSPALDALRRAGDAAGRLFRAGVDGAPGAEAVAARRLWAEAARLDRPSTIRLKAAEGFAWYALHPEYYLAAGRALAADIRTSGAVVVGLRSVGAPLASVVAAGLQAEAAVAETVTVRPRGHPFDRTLALGPRLEAALRAKAAEGRLFVVVDEGPGLSGSSLTGAAEALVRLGAPETHVVLVPAHDADPARFVSERARLAWRRFRRVPATAAAPDPAPALDGATRLSGGLWRRESFGRLAVPTAPAFERRKHLDADGLIWKFAGLGRRGRLAFDLQAAAAEAGFGPRPVAFARGYVATARLDARPLRRREIDDVALARALDWLVFVARSRGTGAPADPAPLADALRRNAELAGLGPLSPAAERTLAALPPAPAVRVDGRFQPHEWLAGPAGLLKTDAVDHGDDHFLPGPADLAWDVAGLVEEWGLDDRTAGAAGAALATRLADPSLPARLAPYRAFYAAARLGFTTLAAPGAAGRDGAALRRLAAVWRARVARSLARLHA